MTESDPSRWELHEASARGEFDAVKQLIRSGYEPNLISEDNITPLELACLEGHRDVAELLIQSGAIVSREDANYNILDFPAMNGNTEIYDLLREFGANVDGRDGHRQPIFWAVQENHSDIIERMIRDGVSVNTFSGDDPKSKLTPLSQAAGEGLKDICVMLLDAGADPLIRTGDGATPVDLASTHGHNELSQYLATWSRG